MDQLIPGAGGLAIVAALGAVVAFQVPFLRRFIVFLASLVPAALLGTVAVVAAPFWRVTAAVVAGLLALVPLDKRWQGWLDGGKSFAGNDDPLVRGERLAVAQALFPEADYPDLYCTVPADITRPPFDDGRLVGGHRVTWLADRHLTAEALRSASRVGITATVLLLGTLLALYVLSYSRDVLALFGQEASAARVVETWPAAVHAPFAWWSSELGQRLWSGVANLPALLPAVTLFSIGTGLLVMMVLMREWQQQKAVPYELATKDADVRWPFRAETRQLLRSVYRQQVLHATDFLKDAPTYDLGAATGVLRARGDLTAPVAGQTLKLDQESLFQHLLVFGGTGEGKTTALLKPLLRQLLLRLATGFYVCDAKGVLWRDAAKLAQAAGRHQDVIVLGTGADQRSMDLLAGLTPNQAASAVRSVLRQMDGASAARESFFPDMAANVYRNVLSVGRAYGLTPQGEAEARAGIAPYSLWWAYQALLNAETITTASNHVLAFIDERIAARQAAGTSQEVDALLERLATPEFYASAEYLRVTWRELADETRSGIVANVSKLFDGFTGAATLRERFACGRVAGAVEIAAALDGKIVLNALSTIEDGLPARLVSILIKSNLYRAARLRESAMRGIGVNPQDHPCIVLMDEVQEIVTSDPSSGLSDADFWNVARSTGIAGIFATQTVAALQQAIGDHAAQNFMQQARSKVFFRTEDRATVEHACWCAGKAERNRVYDDGQRESLEHRALLDGWTPLDPVDEHETIAGGAGAFFSAAGALVAYESAGMGQAATRTAYAPDLRFVPTLVQQPGGQNNAAQQLQAQQAAAWRAQDQERDFRKSGNEVMALLSPGDMLHMGRWHAFAHVQRAGALRQDVIAVTHDFG